MKTTIHFYFFDVSIAAQKAEYAALCERLAGHPRKFDAMGFAANGLHEGEEVTLDPDYLFDNQWNTVGQNGRQGVRLFDWREMAHATTKGGSVPEKIAPWYVRRGYWLEQTDEMKEIRRNNVKCGFCGAIEPAAKGYVFCPHCMGSEYLNKENLGLTRLIPVCDSGKSSRKLTAVEREVAEGLYNEAQIAAALNCPTDGEKAATKIKAAEEEYNKAVAVAKSKLDAEKWFIENNINSYNAIYYAHLSAWCFGWRSPLPDIVADALESILNKTAAPFAWSIKSESGERKSA